MSTRPPCSQCGRTSFHEEDGILFCDGGHQQEGGQNAAEDDGDYGAAGKLSRKKRDKEKQKVFRIYRGAKGYRLFLQAWQFILWKQCYALVHHMGLPPQLWTLVRELWTLRLTQLVHRYEEEEGREEENHIGTRTRSESDTNVEYHGPHPARESSGVASDGLKLTDTIALCYLVILLLRYPVRLATLYRSIRREEICYIRAINCIPQDIKNHLAPSYHAALDTTVIPGHNVLQQAVMRTVSMYTTSFGMVIPAINWTLLLVDAIRTLCLPLEVFHTTKHLIKLVGFGFAYPVSNQKRQTSTALPEAQLMAVLVVATKLLFPFDADAEKSDVYPQSSAEPTMIQIDWIAWLEEKSRNAESMPSPVPIELGKEIEVTDIDVLDMTDAQLDQYMDWFQRTYAKNQEDSNLHQQILDMFPLSKVSERRLDFRREEQQRRENSISRLRATQRMLKIREVISEDEEVRENRPVLRPGQQYRQYRVPEDLTGAAKAFHIEAAEMACLSVDALLRAVIRTERILLLRQQSICRSEAFDDSSEMDLE